jgi:transposase InsO family protein
LPRERKAEEDTDAGGVKSVSLAAAEEKQTRRNQNTFSSPPSLSSPSDCGVEKVGAMEIGVAGQHRDVSPIVATVELDVSAEAKKRKRKKKVKKEREEQPLVQDSYPLMILGCRVNEEKCGDVLIDGGASSNFALRSWAKQAGLRIRPLSTPIDVTLADRGSVSVTEATYVRSMSVLGSEAECVLLLLDSLSHNVVLGLPWLHAAGVTVDYGQGTFNGLPVHTERGAWHNLHSQLSHLQLNGMKVAPEHEKRMAAILSRVGSVFSTELPKGGVAKNEKAVKCEVILKDPSCRPVADPQRRRSQKDIDTLIASTKEMEQAGLIRPSTSEWRAQAVLVKKYRDGVELDEKRPCWDYRRLNQLIRIDSFPLPLTDDLIDKLSGCQVFSKIDLLKGFWQIPMEEKSKHVLAFSTPIGLYEPNFMPFGMKNAPAVFQREMQRVLRDRLMNGVVVFIDDILIYTKTVKEHEELVEWVLRRLQEEGYLTHPDKCEFFQKEVSFLGHVLNAEGISVQQHKVKAMQDWPVPKNKREVRGFLGLTGYYRRFIKEYGKLAIPLTDLLHQDAKFVWDTEEQKAFDALKERLVHAPVLAHPDWNKQFIVHTDASGFAVSAVLSQKQDDGKVRPLAYLSKKMSTEQMIYDTFDKELLAIVTCIDKWKAYITGTRQKVVIYTDHYALQWIKSCKELTPRQARWLEEICEVDFEVHHVPGKENQAADALSRRPDHQPEAIRMKKIEKSFKKRERIDVQLQGLLAETSKEALSTLAESRPLVPLLDEMKEAALKDEWYAEKMKEEKPIDGLLRVDGLLREPESGIVWVPADDELRSRLMREVHEHGGHYGPSKTMHRLSQMCWWEGMRAKVIDYVRGCEKCARAKSSSLPPTGLLQPLPIPHRPWEVIGIDFVGPLPETKKGHSMILSVTDKLTKMGHFIATEKTVNAEKTARLLLQHVVKHHSLPAAIISDRDPRFTSALWSEVWKGTGTELRMSSSYHPQTDGQTERLNRVLETGLRMYCNSARNDWDECLHMVEAYYNSSVHESTGKTPFELNGTVWTDAATIALRSPAMEHVRNQKADDILSEMKLNWADARRAMMRAQERQKKYADQRRRDDTYVVGDQVMLSTKHLGKKKGKLRDKWVGPFVVKELVGDKGLNVKLEMGKKYARVAQTFHVEKLKRFTPSQQDWPGRVQDSRPLPALEEESLPRQYEVERIIGKRITWEDIEPTKEVVTDSQAVVQKEEEEKGEEEKGEEEEEEEKKIEEYPMRMTRAATRAVAEKERARQIVSVHALRARRAKVSKMTPGKEKRAVVWYLVQWKGYKEEDNSWVREEDMDAPDAIREYEEAQLKGDDLGLHYLHTETRVGEAQQRTLTTRVVGDWS